MQRSSGCQNIAHFIIWNRILQLWKVISVNHFEYEYHVSGCCSNWQFNSRKVWDDVGPVWSLWRMTMSCFARAQCVGVNGSVSLKWMPVHWLLRQSRCLIPALDIWNNLVYQNLKKWCREMPTLMYLSSPDCGNDADSPQTESSLWWQLAENHLFEINLYKLFNTTSRRRHWGVCL